MKNILAYRKPIIIALICLITFICFSKSVHNEFTNWDDDAYVTKDEYIKAFTPENIKAILTEDITQNNYHPFCMLSLAVNFHFSQLNPEAYYVTNIVIHLLNVILVFFLFFELGARLKLTDAAKYFIASLGALLFGIHPMHVESVSWIAERKDVLYCFFYVAALLTYLKFLSEQKAKWYWITFALFLSSCLSKPMGVVFPMSLICIDFLLQRKLDKQLVKEKIVFFLFAFLLGVLAFYTQNKAGTIASFSKLTLPERIMYATYGYDMYLAKVFNPTYLSTFYPYPYRYVTGYLPGIYYAAPFLAIGIPAAVLYVTYKMNTAYFNVAAFGMGFFTVNVMFVLQFISVGAAIMADRYSYVSYIGFFFMIPYFLYELMQRLPSLKTAVYAIATLAVLLLGYGCYQRTDVWHNAETLCSDAIEKYPLRALLSYKWRGNYYRDQGDFDKALKDYNLLAALRSADMYVYQSMARIYSGKNDYTNAYAAAQIAAKLQQDKNYRPEPMPGQNITSINANTGEIHYADEGNGGGQNAAQQPAPGAGQPPQGTAPAPGAQQGAPAPANQIPEDVRRTIAASATNKQKIDPQVISRIAAMGYKFVQEQKFDSAIEQYNTAILLNNNNPYFYFFRGVSYFGKNEVNKAITDWTSAYGLPIDEVKKAAAFNLSVAYDTLNKDSMAVFYMQQAQQMGYQPPPGYADKLLKKKQSQQKH